MSFAGLADAETMGIALMEGQDIPLPSSAEWTDGYLVNASALSYLNWGSPAEAVGQLGRIRGGRWTDRKLIGVVETRQFRDAVLRQRDQLAASGAAAARPSPHVPETGGRISDEVLVDIRDTLHRIESHMARGDDA